MTTHFAIRRSITFARGPIDAAPVRVVALGDSTLTGEGLDPNAADGLHVPDGMWLALALRDLADEQTVTIELVTRARNGSRLRDIRAEIAVLATDAPDVIVLTIGTNDIARPWRLATLLFYRRRYRRLLELLIDAARRAGDVPPEIVVTGVGDLSLSPSFLYRPWFRPFKPLARWASRYVDRQIREAVAALRRRGRSLHLIPPRAVDAELAAGSHWYFAADRFHPSAQGHEVWAQLARVTLRDTLVALGPPGAALQVEPTADDRFRFVPVRRGSARIRRSEPSPPGADQPAVPFTDDDGVVVLIPDVPNTLESYDEVFGSLAKAGYRVLGLEMPNLGRSALTSVLDRPVADVATTGRFDYSLRSGADWILDVLDHEQIARAVVAAPCVAGLWAAKAAVIDHRVEGLVLSQTPRLNDAQAWAARQVEPVLGIRLLGRLATRIGYAALVLSWVARLITPDSPHQPPVAFGRLGRIRHGRSWREADVLRAVRREWWDPLAQLGLVAEWAEDPVRRDVRVIRLWGEADTSYRPDEGGGTDPEPRKLPNAGHFCDLDAGAALVEAVEDVVRSLADPEPE